jgi:hypothetical protein
MKFLFIAFVALASVACNNIPFVKTVTGSGNLLRQTRDISGFNEIGLYGSINVEVKQGTAFRVEVEADDNLMEYIEIKKSGDRLKVSMEGNYSFNYKNNITVRIEMPVLKEAYVAGSGKITTVGVLKQSEKLDVEIAGSGDVVADVDCPEVVSSIKGSGKIKLSGATKKSEVHIAGSGDYLCSNLLSEETRVKIAGSGKAYLHASVNLDISIAGSGDVIYSGNPTISKSIAGSGNVKAAQ